MPTLVDVAAVEVAAVEVVGVVVEVLVVVVEVAVEVAVASPASARARHSLRFNARSPSFPEGTMAATRRGLLKTMGAAAMAGKLFAPGEARGAEAGSQSSPPAMTWGNLRRFGLGAKPGDPVLHVPPAAKQLRL